MSKSKLKFEVGDKVKSAPDSSDVVLMENTWYATIHRIVGENDHGGCYETIGSWSDEHPSDKWTLRQLWGDHLSLNEEMA